MSEWYKDAVFYELNVRAFQDGNGDGIGDLPGLLTRLDYLQSLGVDCLWLLPIYPSPLRDDGYDIADYRSIHPDYGTLDDFKTLVQAVHARGMRIITDLVLNHTSDQHPWFQAARADRNSPYYNYYVWSDTGQEYAQTRIIFLDTETSNWTWDEQAGQYYWHRFYSHQPDLNYDNPAVRQEMLEIVRFWLDLGVDGFRVDAVPYLYEREGTNCENLPETHAFLKELRALVDTHYPGRLLLCEANQWPEDLRPYFGEGDEFHMGFHFPLMPRIFMALKKGHAQDILSILKRTPAIPPSCQWATFLRNHDELTLEMVTPEERAWMWEQYAPEAVMRLNLGIRRRLAPLLDGDRRKIELAHSLLLTLPGSPVLYYGDEIGLGENLTLPDRNGVRTPMQWDDSPFAGFSTVPPYAPFPGGEYHPARVNVAAQLCDPHSFFHRLQHMLTVRKRHRVFGRGTFAWVESNANLAVAAYLRSSGGETILILNNLSNAPQPIAIEPNLRGASRDLLTGWLYHLRSSITLAPYQFLWLSLEE
ncbi:MAG: maltose alpha-D-glucosyltransferase [Anaerolineae bacterium]|nr:MAG: maltose alpha-D-glucosyltransferase [Anaerolineae bacterium]